MGNYPKVERLIGGSALLLILAASCISAPSYTVRGVVINLVPEADSQGRIVILHEAIENFENENGKKVGMEPMAMSFGVTKKVPLSEINPGDKVFINFDMRWKKDPRMLITRLEHLDKDTQLDLGGYVVEGLGKS